MKRYVFCLVILIFSISSLSSYGGVQPDSVIQNEPAQINGTSVQISDTTGIKSDFKKNTSNLLLSYSQKRQFSFITFLRGLGGMVILLGLGFLFSKDRKHIPWKTVAVGLVFQIILAISILYVPFVRSGFEIFGQLFVKILDFTKAGSEFLFGSLLDMNKSGSIFAFQILPTMVFFSALTSLLFYWGIIQKVVWVMAWVFTRLMKLSGAEALSATANIFLGMTEAPLMIKAYLPKMNHSEIMMVMTGG
ncbi:MAG: Na+ dependent nucleoside transporter N-terminal domain-containing protein, partial [Mangrovibacterium sp.]|nr:Na+ dependent nucleoside transporter N-terminal domain-containing protein [Mangrovibacterium sp.]